MEIQPVPHHPCWIKSYHRLVSWGYWNEENELNSDNDVIMERHNPLPHHMLILNYSCPKLWIREVRRGEEGWHRLPHGVHFLVVCLQSVGHHEGFQRLLRFLLSASKHPGVPAPDHLGCEGRHIQWLLHLPSGNQAGKPVASSPFQWCLRSSLPLWPKTGVSHWEWITMHRNFTP